MNAPRTAVRNSVRNGVTNGVLNGPRCWVQNQNQNQTVVTAVCGSSVADQSQIVKAVEARGSRRLGLVIER